MTMAAFERGRGGEVAAVMTEKEREKERERKREKRWVGECH